MSLDIWSIFLIVFSTQCVFLIITLAVRVGSNKPAGFLLLSLLFLILCINVSNLVESSYLYRKLPVIAGFSRGMVFLLGPVIYLYTLAALSPHFRFRPRFLLHIIPYLIALVLIRIQLKDISERIYIASVDSLMAGTVKMTVTATLWFVAYAVHITLYMAISRRNILHSFKNPAANYVTPIAERVSWLKRITAAYLLVLAVFAGIITYVVITGYYSIIGNFIYSMALAVMVYLIAFQAMSNRELLSPDFATRYRSVKLDERSEEELFVRILNLFDNEKIFTDPDLRITTVAQRLNLQTNLVSQIINEKMDKSFSELVNEYRIAEFKERLTDARYAHYSIMGIAYDVGYRSKTAFNGVFKKKTGLTPSEYLKSLQKTV